MKASKVCFMLFPRCIHRRLCCVLLHEFHTTRPYLGISTNPIQTDPFATHVIIDPKPSPPRRLPSKRDSRKTRKKRQEISVGGAEVLGPSLSTVLRGKLSSSSAPTEREAHLVASENAGGSSYPFYAVLSSFTEFMWRRRHNSPTCHRRSFPRR